jgi:hypothetical protein
MKLPDPPTSLADLPAWTRQVNALLRAYYPRPGSRIRPKIGPGGTSFDIDLPAGGSSAQAVTPNPFQLIAYSPTQIRVTSSTFDGSVPDFPSADQAFSDGDDPPCLFTPTGAGILFGHAEIDQTATSSGDVVTAVELDFDATVPADTDTDMYVRIGSWSMDDSSKIKGVSNDRYGPITITVCRSWYATTLTWDITIQ